MMRSDETNFEHQELEFSSGTVSKRHMVTRTWEQPLLQMLTVGGSASLCVLHYNIIYKSVLDQQRYSCFLNSQDWKWWHGADFSILIGAVNVSGAVKLTHDSLQRKQQLAPPDLWKHEICINRAHYKSYTLLKDHTELFWCIYSFIHTYMHLS